MSDLTLDPSFPFWRYDQILWALDAPNETEKNRRIRRLNAVVELMRTDNGELDAIPIALRGDATADADTGEKA